MFISMEGAVNLLELEREIQVLTGVRSGSNTWYIENNHILFVNPELKKEHEFHKYTDGSLSPISLLVRKHKTIPSQIERLRAGKMVKLEARVKRMIHTRYGHRDEMNALLLGIEDKEDATYLEYRNFLVKLNSKAEKLKRSFLRLPHKTGKDLQVLIDFPISISVEEIVQEIG